jgi:hypothetical protein
MVICVEITHSLPPEKKAEPLMVLLAQGGPGESKSDQAWQIDMGGRKTAPVTALLREHGIKFNVTLDGNVLSGTGHLPAIVIGSLARLPYTFRT